MISILKGFLVKYIGGSASTKEGSFTNNYTKECNLELRKDEKIESYLYQHYGFTSRPMEQVEVVFIRDGNLTACIAEDDGANRPVIEEHETCIYTDVDNYIKIDKDGNITVKSNGKSIILDNGQGTIKLDTNGQVNINNGNLTVDV